MNDYRQYHKNLSSDKLQTLHAIFGKTLTEKTPDNDENGYGQYVVPIGYDNDRCVLIVKGFPKDMNTMNSSFPESTNVVYKCDTWGDAPLDANTGLSIILKLSKDFPDIDFDVYVVDYRRFNSLRDHSTSELEDLYLKDLFIRETATNHSPQMHSLPLFD